MTTFRDRIKGLARLPGERIEAAPLNPRTHDEKQRGALRGLLTELGVIAAGVVWVPDKAARAKLKKVDSAETFTAWLASFDGVVQLVDGHLRREELAAQDVPVLVTDLDAQEAKLALATFDPVGELAGRDLDRLRALLGETGKAQEKRSEQILDRLRKLVKPKAPPPERTGHEVKLVVGDDAHVAFIARVRRLAAAYKTTDVTATVLEAVKRADAALKET